MSLPVSDRAYFDSQQHVYSWDGCWVFCWPDLGWGNSVTVSRYCRNITKSCLERKGLQNIDFHVSCCIFFIFLSLCFVLTKTNQSILSSLKLKSSSSGIANTIVCSDYLTQECIYYKCDMRWMRSVNERFNSINLFSCWFVDFRYYQIKLYLFVRNFFECVQDLNDFFCHLKQISQKKMAETNKP